MTENEKAFNQAADRLNREMNEMAKTKEEWCFVNGLKKFMDRKGYTQRELADKLHLSHTAVGKWMDKDSEPNLTSIKRLVRLGMSSNEIFGTTLSKMMLSKR